MKKKDEIALILFIIGFLLVFFTELSNAGLILITLSIGITCIQLIDKVGKVFLKGIFSVITGLLNIDVIIFILTRKVFGSKGVE